MTMTPPLTVCRDFADLLEYPGPQLRSHAEALRSRLEPLDEGAAALIGEFLSALDGMSAGRLEEIYTGAFDLQPEYCLYAGHHLFGEDRRRNLFLARLAEHYRARSFSPGRELPDYLPALLRFVAGHESEAETQELIEECIVPALRKLAGASGPYALPPRAALRVLTREAAQ